MKMIDSVFKVIDENDKFVILAHKKPDGDAIGSSLAFCELLNKLGKTASIVQHDDFAFNLKFLKNDYFKKEVDYKPDVVVCLDSADITRVSDRMIYDNSMVLNIDHHITNTKYGDVNYVDASSSSTGEIIYRICEKYNLFTNLIYVGIYTAMVTDTNRFYYSNTGANTLKVVTNIYENLDDIYELNKKIYGSIPLNKVKLGARAIEKAEFYSNNKIAITVITTQDQEEIGSSDTDDIVETLRDIEGVEVAVLLYHYKGNLKVSLRSKSFVDVSKIAKSFGGGGHTRASGISLTGEDIYEFKNIILELVQKCME